QHGCLQCAGNSQGTCAEITDRAAERSHPGDPAPSTFRDPAGLLCALAHHAGDAARASLWPGNAIFEVAEGDRTEIARPDISPGPAGFLAFAGALAALAGRVRRQLEVPIIAARAIDGELDRSGIHLDDAGTAHTRHAAGRGNAWRDPRLEPAY